MKPRSCSAKGSKFERDVARKLSLWLTDGKRDDVFWRTAGSGSLATRRRKTGQDASTHGGDIGCVDPIGAKLIEQFYFELKHWRQANWQHFVYGVEKSPIVRVWTKLCDEAREAEKEPVLVLKENMRPILVGYPYDGYGPRVFMEPCGVFLDLSLAFYSLDEWLRGLNRKIFLP